MTEEWKPIPGFPNYEVSSYGNVRSLAFKNQWGTYPRSKPMPLRISVNRGGYLWVHLSDGENSRCMYIARLVLMAFVGPPFHRAEAAHNDGNKINNHLDNLRWATTQENINDKKIHGTVLKGEESPSAKLTTSQVLEIRAQAGKKMNTELAREYNVGETIIGDIIHRKKWAHLP